MSTRPTVALGLC
jgi:hypothetical protein